VLARRTGDFDLAEDAVQEALLAAARQWPEEGRPGKPLGWLLQVAGRRAVELIRSEQARRQREVRAALREPAGPDAVERDDSLTLFLLCCHPALSPASAVALTLRSVGGLTTAEIARAFLVPETTMGRRISRAKERIKAAGARFAPPTPAELPGRLDAVLRVLYLVFTEGYTASGGPQLRRVELAEEAIRLARLLVRLLPGDAEAAGLLALMLLTEARGAARTGPAGELVPLDEQDRSRWDADRIAEGVALLTAAMRRGPVGPYQVQAAVAALHDEAESTEATDWPQILALYGVLERLAPSPLVTLNRAVALAMAETPAAGLALLETVAGPLTTHHHFYAARAHLRERAGDRAGALADYRTAAARTASTPERNYLLLRGAALQGR
jgi:RNA polymerase sigma factor (sigma-70 family)